MKLHRARLALAIIMVMCVRPAAAGAADSDTAAVEKSNSVEMQPTVIVAQDTVLQAPTHDEASPGVHVDPKAKSAKTKTSVLKLQASQSSFVLDAEDAVLPWHEWHERVGRVIAKRVRRAAGMTMGVVNLTVVVNKDHKLSVDLNSSSDDQLGERCRDAVLTLNEDPTLEFPEGSKRDQVVFNFSFKRHAFSLGHDRFIKDDYEHMNKD